MEVKICYVIQPPYIHLVQMAVCLQPRDRLIVRSQVEIRLTACGSRGATAKEVVLEDAEGVYDSQEFQDVCRVRSLRRGQLSTLISFLMLVSVVIRLCQNCSHLYPACVCCQDCPSSRIERSKDRS